MALSVLAAMAAPAWAQGRAQFDAISVHLFLEKSGTLSPDVTSMNGFYARNYTAGGEGIAEDERFDAILIKVRLTSQRGIFAKGQQAEITLTNRMTKKIVKRERIANVYIGANGVTSVPVFASDVACIPLDVVATGGGKRIARTLEFSCGE